jgi:hypothetical protein
MPADIATLRLRYPAFATVADETIAYWLTDAARIVTADWAVDEEPGLLALAAHSMAINGALASGDAGEAALAKVKGMGVTSFRSASFSATVSDAVIAAQAKGGYASTVYGQEFAVMLRRNVGGPRLVGWSGCDAYTSGGWVL